MKIQLDALWAGKVDDVLRELEQRAAGEKVTAALSYYTTHRTRMDYAAYRARGLQIGSGSVESGCKQVVSARLKGAGMIWATEGAEAVAVVRAWLKSERWQEAMELRGAPKRGYERQMPQERAEVASSMCATEGTDAPATGRSTASRGRGGLAPEMLASVCAELRQDRGQHPWRKPWSVKRQREQHSGQAEPARTAKAA
jgi:hypothetical protein